MKTLRTYQFRPDAGHGNRPENSIGVLYEDRAGMLWLSTDTPGGLYRYDRRNGHLTRFAANPLDAQALFSNEVGAVLEDRSGVLWVIAGDYLHALDRPRGRFTRYALPFRAWLIGEDPAGQLWVSGERLARFDGASARFTSYRHHPADTPTLGNGFFYPMLASRSGAIWQGMPGVGLSKFDPKTGRFTYYRPDFIRLAGHLNTRIINSLYEDEAGILWIGTDHGGLNHFDPATGLFTAYTTRNGLPSNTVVEVLGDWSGQVWLSSDHGITRFNPKTKVCRTYDQLDGLQGDEFYSSVSTLSHTGEVMFGGPNGFNVFHPDSLRDNSNPPPVRLTGFSVLDRPRFLPTDWVELSHGENLLAFEFVALNYVKPEKNQYAYRLVGVDKDWVYAGSRRFARYTNLDPGSYTFRVKASNNEGVWNEQGISVPLLIHPLWWRTGWFVTLAISATLGLLYGAYRYRIGQIRQQEAQKTAFNKKEEEQKTEFHKKVSELEMQALRAQMNPHFIFNCLNSIKRFILKNQPEAASDYLSKFSRLIRLILQNSNSPTVTLENELDALQLYLELEALRFEHKFTFQIRRGEEVEADYLEIPPLIIQPYVENAIWHGLMHKEGTGHISIQVQQENQVLVCAIEDDGIGRQRSAALKSKSATKSKSLGMQITAHRLELMNALYGKQTTIEVMDLVDPAGEACGTRVLLKIPI